jgi:HD-like signal output (HDOD) protein/nitrogen-specific signal transduction histidine kinase
MRPLPPAIAASIEAAHVPPLPHALLRLLQVVDDERRTIFDIAEIVETDPGLSVRVLTAANSPALRRGKPLASVQNCLVALGTRMVRTMATCLSVRAMFERRSDPHTADLEDFWAHSLLVAELARELAGATGYEHPDQAYLAGLLHDTGILVALPAFGDAYAHLLRESPDEAALAVSELASFEAGHALLGAWLVGQWDLPGDVGDAILFHHASAEDIATAGPLPQVLWLAHALSGEDDGSSQALADMLASLAPDCATLDLRRQLSGARQRVVQIAGAIGVRLADGWALQAPASTLPRVRVSTNGVAPGDATAPASPSVGSAQQAIESAVADRALLQALQQDFVAAGSEADLVAALGTALSILFGLSRVVFLRQDADNGDLGAVPVDGLPVIFSRAEFRLGRQQLLAEQAWASGQIVSSFSPEGRRLALLDVQFARALATDGLLCVPMSGRTRLAGVILLGLDRAQFNRVKEHLPWLADFGHIAGLCIEGWSQAAAVESRRQGDAARALERVSRRVSHEAGNPLGIIKGYLAILETKLPDSLDVRKELTVLREEIDRVVGIVDRMGAAPVAASDRGGLNLAGLVEDLRAIYAEALFRARGIEFSANVGEAVPLVACPRETAAQIIINVWKNAAEAMAQGGRLIMTIQGVAVDGQRHAELIFDDTGPGLPEAAQRILTATGDAAGSTGEGEGGAPDPSARRGLGLSIVNRLVRQSGGTVHCRVRQVPPGTSISVLLPVEAAGGI